MFSGYGRNGRIQYLPVEVFIEPTNICNLSCIMCPIDTIKRDKGYIDFDIFKNIVDQIAPYSELVYLNAIGEPMLHPRLFDMVEYCKMKNLKVFLATNATMLTEENSKRLIQAGIDYIILPLDGATKETYEKVRQGAKYEKIIRNINNFLAEKRNNNSKTYVALQMISLEENKHEIDKFLKQWRGNKEINMIRLKPKANLNAEDLKDKMPTTACIQVWRNFNVNWDGTVIPCCFDVDKKYVLGNVAEQSVKDIWTSDKFREFRKMQAANKIDMCFNCDFGQPNKISLLAMTLLSGFRVKKILPIVEKLSMKSSFVRRLFLK
jgi:radical SAM protein with 4Fe4S-binding SPASM domain